MCWSAGFTQRQRTTKERRLQHKRYFFFFTESQRFERFEAIGHSISKSSAFVRLIRFFGLAGHPFMSPGCLFLLFLLLSVMSWRFSAKTL
jgi:hypothetical protein